MSGKLSPLFTWRTVIADSKLPAICKLTAYALSLHMNERGGSCFPGQTRLARETSLSRTTVKKALRQLEADGYLRITRSGTRSTCDYEAAVPAQTGSVHDPVMPDGVVTLPRGGRHATITGSPRDHKSDSYHDSEDVGASAEETRGMEQFKDVMRNLSERKAIG